MIKLQISDREQLKTDYLLAIKPQVLEDLKQLKTTISHLQNASTININEHSRRIAANALVIKETFDIKGLGEKPFIKKNYIASALMIENAANKDAIANLSNVSNILDHLLTDKNALDELLGGEADQLLGINTSLLQKFSIKLDGELKILRLGFRYWDDNAAGKPIKTFFKDKELTQFCPYCNNEPAMYLENSVNKQHVYRFDLDHFYDKARHPMLATSIFNLVPSGQNCNQVNKGTTQFTDQYHMNPYLDGFRRDLVFVPIMDPLNIEVKEIKLEIKTGVHISREEKIMGTGPDNVERLGNANAFQLKSKYNLPEVHRVAGLLLENIRSTINHLKSLEGLLGSADHINHHNNIKLWFERVSYTHFYQKDFGNSAKSKLNRDLLDHYCSSLNLSENLYARVSEILEESYLDNFGGE